MKRFNPQTFFARLTLPVFVAVLVFGNFGVLSKAQAQLQTIPVDSINANEILKKIYESNGYSGQPISAFSLETRMDALKKLIEIPKPPIGAEGIKRMDSCSEALDKVGAGSSISSLKIANVLKQTFWANIIGGGNAETLQLNEQKSQYIFYRACIVDYLDMIKDPGTLEVYNLNESQRLANYINLYSNALNDLSAKIASLEQRVSSGWKDIAKATVLSMILKVNQNVTTNLLNRAINKYKINDYLKYADAVATQIYSMKYLNQMYPDDSQDSVKKKMILRAILMNDGTQYATATLRNAAQSQVRNFVGKICDSSKGAYEYGTLQNLKCIAAQASEEASPVQQMDRILEEALRAKAAGDKAAQDEMADGKGYAPVRNCSGAVSEQEFVDRQYRQVSTDVVVAQKVLDQLLTARDANLARVNAATDLTDEQKAQQIAKVDADIQKARDEVVKAQSAEKKLLDSYIGAKDATGQPQLDSTGKPKRGAIVDICEAIASPANFIAGSLDSFLKQHLEQATQLKTENLPFFAQFFSNVASNFLSRVIIGAFDGSRSNKKVVRESGVNVLTGAEVGSESEIKNMVNNITTSNQANEIVVDGPNGSVSIYAYPTDGAEADRTLTLQEGQNYTLIIDFSQLKDQRVDSVSISGLDLFSGQAADSGRVPLTAEQKQSGKISSMITGLTSGFSLNIAFYSAPPPGGSEPKQIGSYTQNFELSGFDRTPQRVPPPESSDLTSGTGAGSEQVTGQGGEQTGTGEQSGTGDGGTGGSEIKGASIILPRGPMLLPRG